MDVMSQLGLVCCLVCFQYTVHFHTSFGIHRDIT